MFRTLLEVATFEGWLRPLNAAMMATWQGIPLSMEAPFRSNAAVFFFVWVLIGGWVVRVLCFAQALTPRLYAARQGLETFTGVIVDGFQTMKENQAAKRVCSAEQERWISTM
jgi:hypothetical protein